MGGRHRVDGHVRVATESGLFEAGDLRVSPRLEWVLSGSLSMMLGADIFEGGRRTLYGQFDRNDRVTFTTTWRF